jgi:hypothetical protein
MTELNNQTVCTVVQPEGQWKAIRINFCLGAFFSFTFFILLFMVIFAKTIRSYPGKL